MIVLGFAGLIALLLCLGALLPVPAWVEHLLLGKGR